MHVHTHTHTHTYKKERRNNVCVCVCMGSTHMRFRTSGGVWHEDKERAANRRRDRLIMNIYEHPLNQWVVDI